MVSKIESILNQEVIEPPQASAEDLFVP